MNINGPQELYSFIVSHGLNSLCPEAANLVACMDVLLRMCACDPPQAKNAKFNQCKQIYVAFASRASNWAPVLLSKAKEDRIIFYLNGQSIGNISR